MNQHVYYQSQLNRMNTEKYVQEKKFYRVVFNKMCEDQRQGMVSCVMLHEDYWGWKPLSGNAHIHAASGC